MRTDTWLRGRSNNVCVILLSAADNIGVIVACNDTQVGMWTTIRVSAYFCYDYPKTRIYAPVRRIPPWPCCCMRGRGTCYPYAHAGGTYSHSESTASQRAGGHHIHGRRRAVVPAISVHQGKRTANRVRAHGSHRLFFCSRYRYRACVRVRVELSDQHTTSQRADTLPCARAWARRVDLRSTIRQACGTTYAQA